MEEAERGDVLPICLSEIDQARPYFIGFLRMLSYIHKCQIANLTSAH